LLRAARQSSRHRGAPGSSGSIIGPVELSSFGRVLRRMVEETPSAHGAVFTDPDGEPVDQFARGTALDIQIAGAQWGVVLMEISAALARAGLGAPKSLYVACDRMTILVRAVRDGYFVVLSVVGDGHIGKALSNLERAAAELAASM